MTKISLFLKRLLLIFFVFIELVLFIIFFISPKDWLILLICGLIISIIYLAINWLLKAFD